MDLDELERLEKAAFRAPWKYSRWVVECETCTSGEGDECADPNCDGEETECVTIESPDEYPSGQVVAQIDGKGISVPGILDLADRNGELIVALRNAAPALIAAARERDALSCTVSELDDGLRAQLRENDALRTRVAELESRLEAIGKLPEKWRNDAYDHCENDYDMGCGAQLNDCAFELSTILTPTQGGQSDATQD